MFLAPTSQHHSGKEEHMRRVLKNRRTWPSWYSLTTKLTAVALSTTHRVRAPDHPDHPEHGDHLEHLDQKKKKKKKQKQKPKQKQQQQKKKKCGNQTARHHKTTTFRCDHVYDNTSTRAAYVRGGAWVEAPHGWVPVNDHSTPVPGSPGRLWVARYTETTGRPRHDQRRAQHTPQDLRVAHGSGA